MPALGLPDLGSAVLDIEVPSQEQGQCPALGGGGWEGKTHPEVLTPEEATWESGNSGGASDCQGWWGGGERGADTCPPPPPDCSSSCSPGQRELVTAQPSRCWPSPPKAPGEGGSAPGAGPLSSTPQRGPGPPSIPFQNRRWHASTQTCLQNSLLPGPHLRFQQEAGCGVGEGPGCPFSALPQPPGGASLQCQLRSEMGPGPRAPSHHIELMTKGTSGQPGPLRGSCRQLGVPSAGFCWGGGCQVRPVSASLRSQPQPGWARQDGCVQLWPWPAGTGGAGEDQLQPWLCEWMEALGG